MASAVPVLAGGTTPPLALTAASAVSVGTARSIAFTGTFDFENVLEVGNPMHLVVYQGTTFVRFPLAGSPVSGTSAVFADGTLATGEVPTLLAAGSASPAGVRVVSLGFDHVRVTLPSTFGAGSVTAVVVAELSEGTVLSNALSMSLP